MYRKKNELMPFLLFLPKLNSIQREWMWKRREIGELTNPEIANNSLKNVYNLFTLFFFAQSMSMNVRR